LYGWLNCFANDYLKSPWQRLKVRGLSHC